MLTIIAIIAVFYVAISTVTFFAYNNEPLPTRLKLCVIAPIMLAVAGLVWLVSLLEELG